METAPLALPCGLCNRPLKEPDTHIDPDLGQRVCRRCHLDLEWAAAVLAKAGYAGSRPEKP